MQIEEEISERFEQLSKMNPKSIFQALGLEFTIVSRSEMAATMPVDENTIQPFGILHGGASVVLAETLASVGAYLNLTDENKIAVGLEINANHIRPVPKGGRVIGSSKPIHRGAQTQIWETRIKNEEGRLVCISRCTLAIVNQRK